MDVVEIIDIIEAIKAIRCRKKQRPDCIVTTIRQRITQLEIKTKILSKPNNGQNSYSLINDSLIISDNSDPQSTFDLGTSRLNLPKELVFLSHDLNEKLLSLFNEINSLKSIALELFVIKKIMQDIQERSDNEIANNDYVTSLIDQIKILKK